MRISKNIIFYITLLENNKADYTFLRKVIHTVLPQAIVESVCGAEEATHYFNKCSTIPHLIFLDQDMLRISGKDTIELIKQVNGLEQVPIVFLANLPGDSQRDDFRKQGTDHYYAKPYATLDLMNIVNSVNSKWLA